MTAPHPTLPMPLDERIAGMESDLLRFLRRRVGADAEEVAQDVWLRIAGASPPDDTDGFRAYVFVVARRMLIDRYRKKRPIVVAIEDTAEPSMPADAHSAVAASQVAASVERVVGHMKPEMAEVFWMRTREGLAFKDIARRQGTSLNTALGRMHQAVKRLQKALAAEGWT